jgi:hypothetical protein
VTGDRALQEIERRLPLCNLRRGPVQLDLQASVPTVQLRDVLCRRLLMLSLPPQRPPAAGLWYLLGLQL